MKLAWLSLLVALVHFFVSSQESKNIEIIKERVSRTFFKNPEKAKKDAYLLYGKAKTNEEIEVSLKYLGYIYDLTGEPDSARAYLTRRLEFNKEHFKNQILHFDAIISYVNWGKNYAVSETLMTELIDGLSLIDTTVNTQEKGLMYLLLGDIFLKENNLDKASDYFDKSFKLIKGKYVVSDYYLRKSEIEIRRFHYAKAKKLLLKGFTLIKNENIFTYPDFLNKLGFVSLMSNDYDTAEDYLVESLNYQKKNNFKSSTSETYLNLFYLDKKTKNENEKLYLDKAIKHANGNIVLLRSIYLAFKDYYSRRDNSSKEHEYLNKFNKLNDSIFSIERAKARADIESRYQLKENQKEIALKEKIIEINEKTKKLYAIVITLLFLLLLVVMVFFWLKIKAQKKRSTLEHLLHEEHLKLILENRKTEIIKEKVKTKIEEREKLSLEIHDGIANEISALKLSIINDSNLSKNEIIDSTVNKIDKLYQEVRNLSHNLDPNTITEVEFYQLIDKMCSIVEKQGIEIKKQIIMSKKINTLNERILLNLCRIFQEAINNIVKHSNATEAFVEIIETNNELLFEISDNGDGINNSNKSGIGIKNIKTRVTNLNGNVKIISKNGTTIKMEIPI